MNILVNRSDAIGDTILTLPVAKRLKEEFPDAHLIFLVSSKSREIFEFVPYVDEVWVMNTEDSKIKRAIQFLKYLRKTKIDKYLYVGGSHIPSMILFFYGVKIRGGLRSRWPSYFFLNRPVRQKRSYVEMHESDYNLNLLSAFEISYLVNRREELGPLLNVNLYDSHNATEELRRDVLENQLDFRSNFIIIHPGMTGHTLNWPSRNYALLIVKMEKYLPNRYMFVISHTKNDLKHMRGFNEEISKIENLSLMKRIYYLDGGIKGLANYIRIVKSAKAFIGPSTGTTHIANSIGVKQIGLYSPIIIQSALRWGPYYRNQDNCKVIVPDVVCGEQIKCAGESCRYYKCMEKIEVDEVAKEVINLLNDGEKNEYYSRR